MEYWRGVYLEKALTALCATEIAEQVCPECNGSAIVVDKNRNRCKCQCCKAGHIVWTQETRFAYFAQVLPVTYSRFKRYQVVLDKLVVQLKGDRNTAILTLKEKIRREKCEIM